MQDLTKFEKALKTVYTDAKIEDMTYKKNPLYAMIRKWEKFFGKDRQVPSIYANSQGRSATFSKAKARGAATSAKVEAFMLKRVKNYAIATIDNETLLASKSDIGAFLDAMTTEVDSAIRNMQNDHGFELYRSGWGARGRIGSISTDVITLKDKTDIVHFEVEMKLVFAAAEGSGTLRASGGTLEIISVDRSAGSFKCNAAVSTLAGVAADDYIFVDGDREDAASPTRKKMSGLLAWLPDTAPTSTLFFNVDRSKDTTRLGGLREDYSNMPIEEALIEADNFGAREGASFDHYFLPHKKIGELKKSLSGRVQYVDVKVNPRISFRGIEFQNDNGTAKIFGDRNCPSTNGFGLELGLWQISSLGKAVRLLDTDGQKALRMNDEDALEIRYGFYGNVECAGPGANINFKLAS